MVLIVLLQAATGGVGRFPSRRLSSWSSTTCSSVMPSGTTTDISFMTFLIRWSWLHSQSLRTASIALLTGSLIALFFLLILLTSLETAGFFEFRTFRTIDMVTRNLPWRRQTCSINRRGSYYFLLPSHGFPPLSHLLLLCSGSGLSIGPKIF